MKETTIMNSTATAAPAAICSTMRSAVGIRRVTLKGSGKKGSVVLSYDSAEELEMIYAALETLEGK